MLLKTWIYPRPSIFIRFISDKIFRICPVGYRESPLTDVCTPPHLKWRTSGTLVGGDALNLGTLAALRVPGYGRVSSLRDEVSYNRSLTDNLLFAIAFIKRLIFSLSICNGLSELVGVLVGVEIPMSLRALITMKRFLNSLFSPINRLRKNRSK